MGDYDYAETFKKVHPLEYYRKFVAEGIRPDGRGLTESRPVSIVCDCLSSADSSAIVRMGNSSVTCGIKLQLAKPLPLFPGLGFVVPNVELSPSCRAGVIKGPPSEEEQLIGSLIERVLCPSNIAAATSLKGLTEYRSSRNVNSTNTNTCCEYDSRYDVIDRRLLCVEEGELVWSLHCDVVCLDYDAGLLEASLIALMAALSNLTLPKVTLASSSQHYRNNNNTQPIIDHQAPRVPVPLRFFPAAVTYGILDSTTVIEDPTADESAYMKGFLTLVVDQALVKEDGQGKGALRMRVCDKEGGPEIPLQVLEACCKKSKHFPEMIMKKMRNES
eukprot:Nk52_evm13s2542 gene=Nk52_evmTU13s2542